MPSRLNEVILTLKQLLRPKPTPPTPNPESPDDPYAYVGAPKKPRPPVRSASAAVHPEP
jgi:hypothetical protein